jgi:hypothetical protein
VRSVEERWKWLMSTSYALMSDNNWGFGGNGEDL